MSSSLDMALDEIISSNKQKGRGGSRGGISKRGGSGPSNRNNTIFSIYLSISSLILILTSLYETHFSLFFAYMRTHNSLLLLSLTLSLSLDHIIINILEYIHITMAAIDR
ncbi:hypothetical protein BJ944DRAFT_276874 [Cunninghamella echinulata]|nr:hypothetical protein BJ944DRAFT_276874 [Cunninghamella echinulata]